MVDVCGG
jgi:hypothetical protein